MRAYIFTLIFFFSMNAFSATLKHFNEYAEGLNLLEQDLLALKEEAKKKDHYKSLDELEERMATFKNYYAKFHFGATANGLKKKAADMGWPNVERKAAELSSLCSNSQVSHDSQKCLRYLKEFKDFITTSNLNANDKKIINYFFDRYSEKIEAAGILNVAFIADFDKLVDEFNAFTPKSVLPVMTVKITPATEFKKVESIITARIILEAILLSGIVLGLVYGIKKGRESRMQRKFVGDLFRIARKSNMNLRVFGKMDSKILSANQKISMRLFDFFQKTKVISKDVQLKFKNQNNIVFIEATYVTINSLQVEVEKDVSPLKDSFALLTQEVESFGGEVYLSSKFNNKGNVMETGFAIQIQA